MAKIETAFIDRNRATREALDDLKNFEPMRKAIEELNKRNAPIYWEVLWNALEGNDLIEEYSKKHAEVKNEDWNEQDTRNLFRKKFNYLFSNSGYAFPQQWCERHEDGSFEPSLIKIVSEYETRYTYLFTEKQIKAIDDIINGLKTLGVSANTVSKLFFNNNGEIWANFPNLYYFIKK